MWPDCRPGLEREDTDRSVGGGSASPEVCCCLDALDVGAATVGVFDSLLAECI